MSRIRVFLFLAVAFVLGAIAGGGVVVWGYNEFLLHPMMIANESAATATDLVVLRAIRDGQTEKAISFLEAYLDGHLIGLSVFPEEYLDKKTVAILARVSEYREKYPYSSSEPIVAAQVSELLSKHKNKASQQQ